MSGRTGARTVLVTGRGGSGVTTVAAATAVHGARQGLRTLLLAAADPHRTLDGLLGRPLGTTPAPVADPLGAAPGLHAVRVDEQEYLRDHGARLGERAKPLFDLLGVDPLDPEELTPLPGVAHLALLRELRWHAASGRWDLLVVDGPPAPALIAALALPEQLDRYLARLVPEERQAARSLRPLLAAFAGMTMPAEWVTGARTRAAAGLADARTAVRHAGAEVRLVLEPDAAARADLRRTRAGLALFGHRLDIVVANRVLPPEAAESADPWLASLATARHGQLAALADDLAGEVPLLTAPHLGGGPQDLRALAGLAARTYGDRTAPAAGPEGARATRSGGPSPAGEAAGPVLGTVRNRLDDDGVLLWLIPLPGADRSDLLLVRRGDELVVGVGPYRRILPLPPALRRCTVAGAALRAGELRVRFRPDPGLWPRPTLPAR